MRESTFTFQSTDGKEIFTYKWLPDDDNVWLVVQIAHGMAEHAARYAEFAKFLTDKGIAVYANDHRGHGKTAKDEKELGFFAEKDGWLKVLEDMHSLTHNIRRDFPNVPVVLFGHSMGSLLTRAYVAKYPDDVNGIILSGTSGETGLLVSTGKTIAWLQGLFSDKRKPSNLLNAMTFKDYNKAFKDAETDFDWLSRDPEKVREYIEDPMCGFVVSNRFYYDLLSLVQFIGKKSTFINTPNSLPILIFSGKNDPVGNFGKGVKKVYNEYLKAGNKNVELKLYPDGRHEMLNEINRDKVYQDVYKWLEEKFKNN